MDKKYYVGEKPKHRKLQYILFTLFGIFALVFFVSLIVYPFTPYNLEYLTYVSLVLVVICALVPIILGACEPLPLYQWSTKRCLAWLYAYRPEEDPHLHPTIVYSGVADTYIIYYESLGSRTRIKEGWDLKETLRGAVYKINESRLKEKIKEEEK